MSTTTLTPIDTSTALAQFKTALQGAGIEVPEHLNADGKLWLERLGERMICIGKVAPSRAEAIIKGDARCLSIAAASVVAKVTRDRIMVDLAQQHPPYGWDRNMGYPTKAHRQALLDFGVTPFHRRSFAPVHNILCQAKSVTP